MLDKIILASKSKVRKNILEQNNIKCTVIPSNVDEEVIKRSLLNEGATPEFISKNLAELKANKVSHTRPENLVIGADSVIDINGELISKPSDRSEAMEILKKLNSKSHFLISSVCISKNNRMIWNYTDKAKLTMKNFTEDELKNYFNDEVNTLISTPETIAEEVKNCDLLIGGVLIPGSSAPKLVSDELVSQMKKGAAIVDVAIDQGGCIETSKPTTHADPVYIKHDVVHYCVTNMPGAVPNTSTTALTNATLNYALELANKGWKKACKDNNALARGLNIINGEVVYKEVADAFSLDYVELESIL